VAPQRRAVARAIQTQKEDCTFGEPQSTCERGGTKRAKSLELRAAMSLTRREQFGQKRGKAHEVLANLYGSFTEGHNTPDLQDAMTLLGR
jgi:predicted ATPase